MVSDRKLNFFRDRCNAIKREKFDEIDKRYPYVRTDYIGLIAEGKGKMYSEKEIRAHFKNMSAGTCPAVIEVAKLFHFDNERKKAEIQEEERARKHSKARSEVEKAYNAAMDLVFLGTEEELKKALEKLIAI